MTDDIRAFPKNDMNFEPVMTDIKQNPEKPKIEFPCANYPIKVLGNTGPELLQWVIDVMNTHARDFEESQIKQNHSSKGRFVSYTVLITATGEQQLSDIFEDLKKCSAVRMVL